MALTFSKAIKRKAKGRISIVGPAGGGKSFTSLVLARALAGPEGKIAAVDTEHGSLSKYADLFQFDVIELDTFSPENFMASLDAAEAAHYDVFIVDSMSHFWMGKGGALEFVDLASKRHRDQMGGWKDFRPHEREMVDRMIASPCHIIVTMRTKTDYQEVTDSNGKKKRVKVGLAPVQRDGLEYEFDLVGYMDDENNFVIDKSRCPAIAGAVLPKPNAEAFAPFVSWLDGAEPPTPPEMPNDDIAAYIEAISGAADMAALREVYATAYKEARAIGDKSAEAKFEKAKDARKSELSQPVAETSGEVA